MENSCTTRHNTVPGRASSLLLMHNILQENPKNVLSGEVLDASERTNHLKKSLNINVMHLSFYKRSTALCTEEGTQTN